MPLLSLHLLRLESTCGAEDFLKQLHTTDSNIEIIVASKPRYLVVRPTTQDVASLADSEYDLMLLLRGKDGSLPASLRRLIQYEYKLFVGVPSKLLSNYPEKNRRLLKEAPLAKLTGSLDNPKMPESSQNLELSPDLLRFMKEIESSGPVTMLNLLNFTKDGKPSYYQYGQACPASPIQLIVCLLCNSILYQWPARGEGTPKSLAMWWNPL